MAEEERDLDELIILVNEDLQGSFQTTRRALDEVWAFKGWREASASEAQVHNLTGNSFDSKVTAIPAPAPASPLGRPPVPNE